VLDGLEALAEDRQLADALEKLIRRLGSSRGRDLSHVLMVNWSPGRFKWSQ
jgi:hypothetical protein